MIMNGLSQGGGSDSRVPVIYTTSYVGTGTYGEKNPTIWTFDFVPLYIQVLNYSFEQFGTLYFYDFPFVGTDVSGATNFVPSKNWIDCSQLTTEYTQRGCFHPRYRVDTNEWNVETQNNNYIKKSEDGKTIYFYNTSRPDWQFNTGNSTANYKSNFTYYILALGYKEEA